MKPVYVSYSAQLDDPYLARLTKGLGSKMVIELCRITHICRQSWQK